ncbi:MAG: branched-chain amino acid ABC transporter permease [Acidibrevibacterium sp.]|uniref:branched-chain amino acid ABC transporter permease n=1 Tax=Acidibrevibacterium fodinaquatile TaxID=1969806 RepID=UPI0023A8AAE1|nr:branched-chain amino acid ABC transporter permease [Acidibrevibacterium fodinaquatile]MCA7118566.1 branched-chain amino acid ABC transporter permease [Acidibrevibacterium fodinaquatile]
MSDGPRVERWTKRAALFVLIALITLGGLAFGPMVFSPGVTERLSALFIYVILAVMWNVLAGYGGLVSVGQQAFFGLGAYAAIRLSAAGVAVYPALLLAALVVGGLALPIGEVMLRLSGGEFAIGMWVVAELAHLLVNLDPLVQGETGTSLIALDAVGVAARRADTYWAALAAMALSLVLVFLMLRGRLGTALQAIRDDDVAAASIGVRVLATKRVVFVLAAAGAALAGALWLATAITFQPHAYFSVQWTAYMIFMTLVGGLGTFEGPVLGALLFFVIETAFGASGVWYLVGLGAAALGFALFAPRGLWGGFMARFAPRLLPLGYHVVLPRTLVAAPAKGGKAP